VVIYEHESRRIGLSDLDVPRHRARTDDVGDIENAIDFLASGAVVLTNTYHGAYWSMLLGRKTIVIDPWSTKFTNMKYEPALATRLDWERHIADARIYPDMLDECRAANRKFYAEVVELFERGD